MVSGLLTRVDQLLVVCGKRLRFLDLLLDVANLNRGISTTSPITSLNWTHSLCSIRIDCEQLYD